MHKAAEASEDVQTVRLTWGEGHDTEVFGQLVPVLDAKVLPREDGHARRHREGDVDVVTGHQNI